MEILKTATPLFDRDATRHTRDPPVHRRTSRSALRSHPSARCSPSADARTPGAAVRCRGVHCGTRPSPRRRPRSTSSVASAVDAGRSLSATRPKMLDHLHHQGIEMARHTVERLMRSAVPPHRRGSAPPRRSHRRRGAHRVRPRCVRRHDRRWGGVDAQRERLRAASGESHPAARAMHGNPVRGSIIHHIGVATYGPALPRRPCSCRHCCRRSGRWPTPSTTPSPRRPPDPTRPRASPTTPRSASSRCAPSATSRRPPRRE